MNFKKTKLKHILINIFCIGLIFFALKAGFSYYDTQRELRLAKETAEIYESTKAEEIPLPTPSRAPDLPKPAISETPAPDQTPKPREYVVRPEFEALRAQYDNEHIIGFLTIEGTSISYPVLQYEDNDFYLSRDINKKNNQNGSIFLDYENDIKSDDMNTIIYGHNMNSDIMFHSIRNYKDPLFWENHKYVQFNTLYDDMIFEIFSFYTPNESFPYIYANYEEHVFNNLLTKIDEMEHYDTGINVNAEDRIIHLSTCTNVTDDTRMAIVGRLIEINGEKIHTISQ